MGLDRFRALQDENKALREIVSASPDPEQVEKMRRALISAKSTIEEQDELLQRLTAPPLVHGYVVSITKIKSTDLKAGVKARAPGKSEFGRVRSFDSEEGTVSVEYGNGGVESYYFANPRPGDLEHKDSSGEKSPISFKKGMDVRVLRGVLNGKMGKVIREVDNEGEVRVRFPNGDDDYFFVGYVLTKLEVQETEVGRVVVSFDNKLYELEFPTGIAVQPGDLVTLSTETMQIVGVSKVESTGEIVVVKQVLNGVTEVDFQGTSRLVFSGPPNIKVEKGDRVILDPNSVIIARNLGHDQNRYRFESTTNITWNDIGGLVQAKAEMIEAIELPVTQKDLYRFYNKKPIKGVLLWGPPGCGKTMLGKAAATALARVHGATASGFLYVKGPEILDKFVGVPEAAIRQLFEFSRRHKEKNGYPAVIFIDEAEAILRKRGSGISSDIESTIVPMFLAEMDGLEDSGAVVILATNRADILDPAVVRDGRVDRKIHVGRPDIASATDIFKIYLGNVPLSGGCTINDIATLGSAELFADTRVLYEIVLKQGGTRLLQLKDICNGGMIAGIVDRATSIAMQREMAAKQQPRGIQVADLTEAVTLAYQENLALDHSDEVLEFLGDDYDKVLGIKSLHQGSSAT